MPFFLPLPKYRFACPAARLLDNFRIVATHSFYWLRKDLAGKSAKMKVTVFA